jgi:hypothetical protein
MLLACHVGVWRSWRGSSRNRSSRRCTASRSPETAELPRSAEAAVSRGPGLRDRERECPAPCHGRRRSHRPQRDRPRVRRGAGAGQRWLRKADCGRATARTWSRRVLAVRRDGSRPVSRRPWRRDSRRCSDGEATEDQTLTGTISPNGIVRLRVGVSQITGRPGSCGWSLQFRSVA